MKIIKLTAILGVLIMLSSCSHSLDDYEGTSPKADIKEYFNGPIKAWGIVQDWRGRVVNRFDIDMVGKWEGDERETTCMERALEAKSSAARRQTQTHQLS